MLYKRYLFLTVALVLWMTGATARGLGAIRHISSADGLSNDFVVGLAVDGQGHVWVATEAGVNRIAGKTCQPLDGELLKGLITALLWHDPSGCMLIGTERGLVVYNMATGTMRRMDMADGLVKSSINDMVMAADGGVWLIYGNGQVQHLNCSTMEITTLQLSEQHGSRCAMDDGLGHLYIGHSLDGMSVVDLSTGAVRRFQQQKDSENSLPGNNVRCIYRDGGGRVWVGTDTGLALFHPNAGTFMKVTDATDSYDVNVYDIHQMADGSLWVATDIGGVKTISQPSELHFDEGHLAGLSSLNTRSMVEDDYGNLWVGNHSTGVDFISGSREAFMLLDYRDAAGRQAPVSALTADTEQGFWLASENELAWWQDGALKGRWSSLNDIRREYAFIRCMLADHQGGVWLGIDDQGVYRFNKLTERLEHIPVSPEGSDIHSFAEDAQGHIWIGGETAVYLYQGQPGSEPVRQDFISQTIHAPATCIMPTAAQKLFIATLGDGIYSFDLLTNTYRHLSIEEGLPSSKVNHTVRTSAGALWLATDGGLVRVDDPVGLTGISVYGRQQGLNDDHVLALQLSADGHVWMSTFSGISCFVSDKGLFYNYNHQDTRLTGGFASGAAMTDARGNICFGSAAGVCYFNPLHMHGGGLSEIQIISCEAYNPVGSNTEIQTLTPDQQGRVYTTYQQNTIRLTFAMRNFAQTRAVDYSYMMKGMDGKWYDIGNDHDVVFRGLRPGHYTFTLRARLRSQDWSEAQLTQLTIIIAPPFWRSWWAYVLYALLAVALAAYFIRSYKRKLTLRSALELERRESQQKQEMNEERLRFFTNITHELRTPLTLILGPLDDLMNDSQLPPARRRLVGVIQKNADRLRDLINQILEFRKTETQNRRLTVARGDIGQFVREIWLNYQELNRNPKVQFVCNIDEQLPAVWFDSEVITTILSNLLSNAIKYTEQGSITTSVRVTDGQIHIAVADTGYGISPQALPHVFERYYQEQGSHQASGTGIGLALVKSLAELHEGQVKVESQEGQGSTFTFSMDAANTYPNALHKEDQVEDGNKKPTMRNEEQDPALTVQNSLSTLLVVEDNDDIRQYIADTFSYDFQILQATNGEEGLLMAREHIPDIIVSDVMMPRMDGIQLTRQLKEDIRTSHIPVILLTAKSGDDDKEQGYDSGADSYLTKPFTAKLLASRIKNLLTARRRLMEMVANGGNTAGLATQTAVATPQLSPLDQEFVNRLNRLIEEHIMKDDIDMAFVTDKMAMSHSTFYRKVKALTGMTATEYIRKRRLLHCYQLLQSGDYNVSQAAMMTGFNQMAHFRETFKKEFGILPSEVKKKE